MGATFEPDGHDVLVSLRFAAAAGDARAAAFLPMFQDWIVRQEAAEDAVSRFLGMRAR